MKTDRFFYAIVMLLTVLALSLALLPTTAQDDDWPEVCELPDLEEAMRAAEAARAGGDVVAFLNELVAATTVTDNALSSCLESAVKNDVDLEALNLGSTDLRWVDLRGANLQGKSFAAVNLEFANLSGANLEGAWFNIPGTSWLDAFPGNLRNVDLSSTNLQDAYLTFVNLERSNLTNAHLQRAVLYEANLSDANLRDANLEGANLNGAYLKDTQFNENTILPDGVPWTEDRDMRQFTYPREWITTQENLRETYLARAWLKEANLQRMDLRGANLQDAHLYQADLQDVHLGGANLQHTNLQGADLKGANLEGADLTNASFHITTRLPDGTNWAPDTDMARFTDTAHPGFWDPCVELEHNTPLYCESEDSSE